MFPSGFGDDLVSSALSVFTSIIGEFYGVLGIAVAALVVGLVINTIVRRS